jgi:hypothetical protein
MTVEPKTNNKQVDKRKIKIENVLPIALMLGLMRSVLGWIVTNLHD